MPSPGSFKPASAAITLAPRANPGGDLLTGPEPRASWDEDLAFPPPASGGLGGYLLAWTASLSFCGGLVGLAVLPALEVAVPRGAILGYGAGCALLALVALLLSRT